MRPDPGLVVDERLGALVPVARGLIAPLLDDDEVPRVIQRLCELIRQAAHLPSHPCLRCTHELSDLLAAGNLGVDVAESDDHAWLSWLFATIRKAYPGIDGHSLERAREMIVAPPRCGQ